MTPFSINQFGGRSHAAGGPMNQGERKLYFHRRPAGEDYEQNGCGPVKVLVENRHAMNKIGAALIRKFKIARSSPKQ